MADRDRQDLRGTTRASRPGGPRDAPARPGAGPGDDDSSPAAWGTGGGYEALPGESAVPARRRGPKGWQRSDERILDDVCQRLADERGVDPSDVSVAVSAGTVTLAGTVPDRGMKYRIEDLVESCSGVREVDNRLRVARAGPGSSPGGGAMGGAAMGLSTTTDARGAGGPAHESRGGLLGRLFGFAPRAKLGDVMTRSPRTVAPDASIAEVARVMRDEDVGAVPVVEDGALVGMVTDRDLVVRVLADGRSPDEVRVADAMTGEVHACLEEDDVESALDRMADLQVRRIPVLGRDGRLVGIVSLGDFATRETGDVQEALQDISQPS